jgi:hypothetical protein
MATCLSLTPILYLIILGILWKENSKSISKNQKNRHFEFIGKADYRLLTFCPNISGFTIKKNIWSHNEPQQRQQKETRDQEKRQRRQLQSQPALPCVPQDRKQLCRNTPSPRPQRIRDSNFQRQRRHRAPLLGHQNPEAPIHANQRKLLRHPRDPFRPSQLPLLQKTKQDIFLRLKRRHLRHKIHRPKTCCHRPAVVHQPNPNPNPTLSPRTLQDWRHNQYGPKNLPVQKSNPARKLDPPKVDTSQQKKTRHWSPKKSPSRPPRPQPFWLQKKNND